MEPKSLTPLPERTRLLHLGPTKTGSTTLQFALFARQAELAEHGVCYPGSRAKQQRPLAHLLDWQLRRGTKPPDPEEYELVERQIAAAGDRRVVLSSERLGRASGEEARRVVEHYGAEHPHVVAVARRYDRYLPSEWQQNVKQLETRSYDAWLRLVLGPPRPDDYGWRFVWTAHDTVGLAQRWGELVGWENLTILVADEDDRSALFTAFERLLGLPLGFLAEAPVPRTNRSYGYEEIELLRRWNKAFAVRGVSSEAKVALVRQAARRLERLPTVDRPSPLPLLPVWSRAAVTELSERRIEGLRHLQTKGLRVVGDLERLRVPDAAFGEGEAQGLSRFSGDEVDRLLTAIAESSRRAVRSGQGQRGTGDDRGTDERSAPAPGKQAAGTSQRSSYRRLAGRFRRR